MVKDLQVEHPLRENIRVYNSGAKPQRTGI